LIKRSAQFIAFHELSNDLFEAQYANEKKHPFFFHGHQDYDLYRSELDHARKEMISTRNSVLNTPDQTTTTTSLRKRKNADDETAPQEDDSNNNNNDNNSDNEYVGAPPKKRKLRCYHF